MAIAAGGVAAGLGAGGIYVCYQMNKLTNEIADTIEDLANRLKSLLSEVEGDPLDNRPSPSNYENVHDDLPLADTPDSKEIPVSKDTLEKGTSTDPKRFPDKDSSEGPPTPNVSLASNPPSKERLGPLNVSMTKDKPSSIDDILSEDADRASSELDRDDDEIIEEAPHDTSGRPSTPPTDPESFPGETEPKRLYVPFDDVLKELKSKIEAMQLPHQKKMLQPEQSINDADDKEHPSTSGRKHEPEVITEDVMYIQPQNSFSAEVDDAFRPSTKEMSIEHLRKESQQSNLFENAVPSDSGYLSGGRNFAKETSGKSLPSYSTSAAPSQSASHGSDKDTPIRSSKPCILTAEWIQDVDRKLNGNASDREKAFHTLKSQVTDFAECSELLWRLAKGAHQIASLPHQDENDKLEWNTLAHEYAKQAVETNGRNARAHKWFAITLSAMNDYVPLHEKIHNICTYKKHVDKAIKLRPNDASLRHTMGKWCLELSKVSWLQLKASGALCWCLLNVSVLDAIMYFEQAHDLRPNWKHNVYYLTLAYLENQKYEQALDFAKRGLGLPNATEEDKVAHDKLEKILALVSTYPRQNSHDDVSQACSNVPSEEIV